MRKFLILFIICSLGNVSIALAQANEYGYSENNPILVGTGNLKEGPINELAYLNNLTGPNGETISYNRVGSCCEFETKNGPFGGGLLDKYEVVYEGLEEPVILYLNMYDPDPDAVVEAPKGFELKED